MKLNKKIDELKDELILSTQQLVKIPSIEGSSSEGMPFGKDVNQALESALDICRKQGLKTVNLDGYVGYAEIGTGEDYVGILGHVDVVPEGEGWLYPPFAAEIHDDKIYGRGTLDDKGPMMAALFGLKAIMECDLKLSKKVRLIFGTNEESGCCEISHYLNKENPPISGFTPDGQYPIIYGEKGITNIKMSKYLNKSLSKNTRIKYIQGGLKENMVPEYCEAALQENDIKILSTKLHEFKQIYNYDIRLEEKENLIIIKSFGISAHGSLPENGKNSIMQLIKFLCFLDLPESDIKKTLDFLDKSIGMEFNGQCFGLNLEDKESGKLTFNVGIINMIDDRIDLYLNLRYPVTKTFDNMIIPFEKKLKGTGFKYKILLNQSPLFFKENHPLIKTLKSVYEKETGLDGTPIAIGGGTYAKEMPNTVAFGPIFPGKPDLDHQVNECIEIEDLVKNAKIYAHAIYELAK